MMACGNGDARIVKALFAHGADPNHRQKDGDTALMDGASVVEPALFAKKGADVNAKRRTARRSDGSQEERLSADYRPGY